MKCDIPIIVDLKIKNKKRKKNTHSVQIMGKKENLPEELQIGHAWKVFGKWLVAMGESDQNEINIEGTGLKSGHVCIVLRGIGFTFYFYELIGSYTEEQYKAFDHIRLLLDRVLVTNQAASQRLKSFIVKKEKWKGILFPNFFSQFPQEKIAEWSDDIDKNIEKWSNTKFKFENIDRNKYWNQICDPTPENLKWDIKGCYEQLLSAFNTLKYSLPKENIEIIDELILRCEHGYFLGYILDKTIRSYEKKYPELGNQEDSKRSKSFLINKVEDYRKKREEKVKLAANEAFGLTSEVKKKLKRMFEFEGVK